MLKPEDIEKKTFSTALRGYDLNEVDDFLDDVIATVRDLGEQLATARSSKAPAGKHDPVHDESAVGRALIAAQTAADKLLEDARQEADRIRVAARSEADTWVNEREALRAAAEMEMADLTARISNVRRELAVLANGVAENLDQMEATLGNALHSAVAEKDEVATVADPASPVVYDRVGDDSHFDELWDSEDTMESDDSPDFSPVEDLDEPDDEGDVGDPDDDPDAEDEGRG